MSTELTSRTSSKAGIAEESLISTGERDGVNARAVEADDDPIFDDPKEQAHDQMDAIEYEYCVRCGGVIEETDRHYVAGYGWMHDDCGRRLHLRRTAMKLKLTALVFGSFVTGLGLSAFTKSLNPMEAIGLAVVLLGTSLFIGAMLFLAGFGAWILYLCCVDGIEGAAVALKESGFAVKAPSR